VVLTGDYRERTRGGFHQILPALERIVQTVAAKDGIIAVLGNHDTCKMVPGMENMGITVLANETITLHRQGDILTVTGIDDPHYYYTDHAIQALDEPHANFKIALVHSPELADVAADRGYHLYLCGHTHAGQICLPGGFPIITHLHTGGKYARGLWRHSEMIGYTSSGCGTVGIPIRFNCKSEIALIRLERRPG
ncbi:MAG: metallophosphoesterase, partial [Desulfobacterales bacterium]